MEKSSFKNILSLKWCREINRVDSYGSRFTFAGALEDCFTDISIYWDKKTKKENISSFENIILPAMRDHDDKLISEYSVDDFDNTINIIIDKGYIIGGVQKYYKESTIKKYRGLIYRVVYYASIMGYCENIFWGTYYELDLPSPEELIREHIVLKKSLEKNVEKKLFNYFFSERVISGEEIGVCLMYSLGLRNAEATGLNLGDIKILRGYNDVKIAMIYKTTIPFTNALQSGGKTVNAGRMIPVPQVLYDMIEKRKKYIIDCYENLGREINIDELPLCCRGKNFEMRCSADDISMAAKRIFQEVGIESKQLAYIDAELREEKLQEALREKNPTAYLLRRNYATKLYLLQLNASERQYLMGHDIENEYETRNAYNDYERIYSMAKRMKKRMFFSDYENFNTDIGTITIGPGKMTDVIVSGNEPYEQILVKVKGDCIGRGVEAVVKKSSIKKDYSKQIPVKIIK